MRKPYEKVTSLLTIGVACQVLTFVCEALHLPNRALAPRGLRILDSGMPEPDGVSILRLNWRAGSPMNIGSP